MPKDHYVAQTYLKKFSVPDNHGCVDVIRKSNLQKLKAVPVKSICCEKDWSDNPYFADNPRIIEDVLKIFEPKWTDCVEAIEQDRYDDETKYLMAGYIAYLRVCTPTAGRLGSESLVDLIKPVCDKGRADFEEKELANPDSQYHEVIKRLRKHGGSKIEVDQKYPIAFGASRLVDIQEKFSTSPWIVFKNDTPIPLITSDNPVCIEYHDVGFADFYLPLTPSLAIVIHPLRKDEERQPDRIASFKKQGVKHMNRLVVQSAEDLVISNDITIAEKLVEKYHDWRVEVNKIKIPYGQGRLTIHQQRPCKKSMEFANV